MSEVTFYATNDDFVEIKKDGTEVDVSIVRVHNNIDAFETINKHEYFPETEENKLVKIYAAHLN